MFDSIVNEEVRYPKFLSADALAIMKRVSCPSQLTDTLLVTYMSGTLGDMLCLDPGTKWGLYAMKTFLNE